MDDIQSQASTVDQKSIETHQTKVKIALKDFPFESQVQASPSPRKEICLPELVNIGFDISDYALHRSSEGGSRERGFLTVLDQSLNEVLSSEPTLSGNVCLLNGESISCDADVTRATRDAATELHAAKMLRIGQYHREASSHLNEIVSHAR